MRLGLASDRKEQFLEEAVEFERLSREAGQMGDFALSGHYLHMSRLAFTDAEMAEQAKDVRYA